MSRFTNPQTVRGSNVYGAFARVDDVFGNLSKFLQGRTVSFGVKLEVTASSIVAEKEYRSVYFQGTSLDLKGVLILVC